MPDYDSDEDIQVVNTQTQRTTPLSKAQSNAKKSPKPVGDSYSLN